MIDQITDSDAALEADADSVADRENQIRMATAHGVVPNTDVDSGVVPSRDLESRFYIPGVGRVHEFGLFPTRHEAEDAVHALERIGITRSEISVILRNPEETDAFAETTATTGTYAGAGAGTGSVVGGTVGAVLGAIIAAATLIVLPGIGIIAGPIAGALAGAGAGGITGGLLGGLIGAGIPEETAVVYHKGLEAGGVVVVVDAPVELATQVRTILRSPEV